MSSNVFKGEVRDLAHDGRGVLRHPEGFIVFVAGVWPGEQVQIRVGKRRGGVAEGTLVDVLESHPGRTASAACAHQGFHPEACGGCPWMFMAYAQQCEAKQTRVRQQLESVGCASALQEFWPAPNTLAYRCRAQLKTDGQRLGFAAAGSHRIADVITCPILSPHNQKTLGDLRGQLPNAEWKPKKRKGQPEWTTLDIDEHVDAESLTINTRRPFAQANPAQNNAMRGWLNAKLQSLGPQKLALELFAGSGNFTEILAQAHVEKIIAVEGASEAVEALQQRAWTNVSAYRADLFKESECAALATTYRAAELLVLDPPRAGWKVRAPFLEPSIKIRDILYISCDLATLIRDLRDIQKAGFKVLEVQALDQCPHTPHIEILVHAQRQSKKR